MDSYTVLGINDGHTAGAAVVRDGAVLAAVQEERLNNIKNFSGVPAKSAAQALRTARVAPEEVDLVAVVSLNRTYAPLAEMPLKVVLFEALSPLLHGHTWSRFYVSLLHRTRRTRELNALLERLKLSGKEVAFMEHHACHAATAYHTRPWEGDTLVLTNDGAGDGLSSTVSLGRKGLVERIASSTYYDSVGNAFYSEITAYLGMKRWEHEYKVMGLAPYGNPDICVGKMRRIIRNNPRRPLEFQNTTGACGTRVQRKLRSLLAGERFDHIAAAAQRHFEELMCRWVESAVKETGIGRIACSGGLFLNVKANRCLRDIEGVEDAFFYPACDDGGTPVGAALEGYNRLCRRDGVKPRRIPLADLYLGMEYDDDEVERALDKAGWKERAARVEDADTEAARLAAKGRIVARCTGRVEWGPRALGNRTIMADPRSASVVRRLNSAIKMRDFWMPFAPSILEERAADYLVDGRFAPYMIEAFDTTKAGRKELAAALHPQDLTARPQTVNGWNPGYQRLIREFQMHTGVGGILNTSFNIHGYPIAGTPALALWTLENSHLDALFMGNWLVRR